MLGLSCQLEELWRHEDADTLESNVLWTALYAFPALVLPGPKPEELVAMALRGVAPEGHKWGTLPDAETADILGTVHRILDILRAYEPPGFAAALWRALLLAIYELVELLVVIEDHGNTDRCFELLDAAEAMADKFTGRA